MFRITKLLNCVEEFYLGGFHHILLGVCLGFLENAGSRKEGFGSYYLKIT